MNPLVQLHSKKMLRKDLPEFHVGDRIKVFALIREGDKERTQPFEGDVLRIHRNGVASSFTVRKISYSVGVERTFPMHSPFLVKIEVLRKGKVRQSRLYYLRKLSGKEARIKEKKLN
jgi:large subunit ribosomal protein L19